MSSNHMAGDGDMDDAAAEELVTLQGGRTWAPMSWAKTPEQMAQEAQSANQSAHAMACAAASHRDDPPEHTALRPF